MNIKRLIALQVRHLTVGISGGKECIHESPTEFRRAADRMPSASCRVRWHALTEPTLRRHTNSRSEVETKRAKRLCKRHLFPFCHTTWQPDLWFDMTSATPHTSNTFKHAGETDWQPALRGTNADEQNRPANLLLKKQHHKAFTPQIQHDGRQPGWRVALAEHNLQKQTICTTKL